MSDIKILTPNVLKGRPGGKANAFKYLKEVDEALYYDARNGSPLAYARPIDLLEMDLVKGRKILDFGFGAVGQLRLLAGLGADVVG